MSSTGRVILPQDFLFILRNESQKSSSDVLTPLVELLLLDDSTRDACVAKLMEREDCEFFLLFGASFGRHLSNLSASMTLPTRWPTPRCQSWA